MEKYIGTKEISATQMTFGDYNFTNYTGRGIHDNKDPERDGYLVKYSDGYESWSPKEVFEGAYRRTDGLTFGLALEAAKSGKKVARSGWNAKGMFIVVQKGYPNGIDCNKNTSEAFGIPIGTIIKVTPYLMMKAADGTLVTGWLASQTDMLSEDWIIVD